jgi:hypothetical protein
MYHLQLIFGDDFITVGTFKTPSGAEWAAARWRSQYGRPSHEGDPFRVVGVSRHEDTIPHPSGPGTVEMARAVIGS